jgi:hypothetical protein
MFDVRFTSLPTWTRKPAAEGRAAAFKTPYTQTLENLEREIRKLDGRDVRIEAGFLPHQIRVDGWPRGGAEPAHAGVVLYFTTGKDEALCFPCATYSKMHHNVHAIALTLECLRSVDRYGVTLAHEQYRGFLALPAPADTGLTVEMAAFVFASFAAVPKDDVLGNTAAFKGAYRQTAARLHPDRGGSMKDWQEFQDAAVILEKHHAGAEGYR